MLRLGGERGVRRLVEGAQVDRAGDEQVLRERLAPAAAAWLLLLLDVILFVVELVVVVLAAAEQVVAELAQPLGDLVHRRRRDDQQAEEGQQCQQDDSDDGADPRFQRRTDRPADEATGTGPALTRIGRRAEQLRDAQNRRDGAQPADCGAAGGPPSGSRAGRAPRASVRGGAAAARRRRERPAAP